MFEYDELVNKATTILDNCDFKEDIEYCRCVKMLGAHEVREFLKKNYLWEIRDALDTLSLDEFMEYLTARYNIQWHKISYYGMY